jgi:hypothetical protein
MNNEQEQIMMEAYRQYSEMSARKLFKSNTYQEFINKCKTDSKFAENWGLQIEERELSLEERYDWFIETHHTNLTRSGNQYDMEDILNSNNCPTKLITITYNDKTIESYE